MQEEDKCDSQWHAYIIYAYLILQSLVQVAGSVPRRRRPDAHALAIAGDRSGDLPVPGRVQRHVLPGSQRRLLQVVQEHHRHVYHRDRSRWTGEALPVQRQIRRVREGDGTLPGKASVFVETLRYWCEMNLNSWSARDLSERNRSRNFSTTNFGNVFAYKSTRRRTLYFRFPYLSCFLYRTAERTRSAHTATSARTVSTVIRNSAGANRARARRRTRGSRALA